MKQVEHGQDLVDSDLDSRIAASLYIGGCCHPGVQLTYGKTCRKGTGPGAGSGSVREGKICFLVWKKKVGAKSSSSNLLGSQSEREREQPCPQGFWSEGETEPCLRELGSEGEPCGKPPPRPFPWRCWFGKRSPGRYSSPAVPSCSLRCRVTWSVPGRSPSPPPGPPSPSPSSPFTAL